MKPLAVAGLVLIVLGVVALVMQNVPYTSRETIVDIGPIHATAENQKTIALPPVLGVIAVAGGAALLVAARRR